MTSIASYRAAMARHLRDVRATRDHDAAHLGRPVTDPVLLSSRD